MRAPRRFLPVLALSLAALPATPSGSSSADTRPNIILIVLDTVRADAVGRAPGSPRTNTPFLDMWSRHGIVFTRALSPADFTRGSHFSILTGYPAGAYNSSVDTPPASVVAQLNAAGYDTLGLSANAVLDPAFMRSIEPFQTFVTSPYVTATALSGEGWDTIQRHDVQPAHAIHDIESNLAKILASARTVNERLAELLSRCRFPAAFRRPVFLFVNFIDAHDPYFPPRSAGPPDAELEAHWPLTGDLRRGRPEAGAEPGETAEVPTAENVPRWRRATDLSPRDVSFLRSLYDKEVRYLDARLSDTSKILAANGLLDRAVVVVTSDHGEAFGEQGYLGHALERHGIHVPELYRVPLIVRGYGLALTPVKARTERFSTAALADSFRSWAGLTRGVGGELDPIAVLASPATKGRKSRRLQAPAPQSPLVDRREPKSADEKARDEELARRLRSLGYVK